VIGPPRRKSTSGARAPRPARPQCRGRGRRAAPAHAGAPTALRHPHPRANRSDRRRHARRSGDRGAARHSRGAAAAYHGRHKCEPQRFRSTAAAVARRQCITPRYIHKLFEGEGLTCFAFVLGRRLSRAPDAERSALWRPQHQLGRPPCRVRRSVLFRSCLPPTLRRHAVRDQAIRGTRRFVSPLIETFAAACRHRRRAVERRLLAPSITAWAHTAFPELRADRPYHHGRRKPTLTHTRRY
jgi:hypothetical protein